MKLIELMEMDLKLKEFFETHTKLLYLANISELMIYDIFEDAI